MPFSNIIKLGMYKRSDFMYTTKRILAILLSVSLVLGMVTVSFAATSIGASLSAVQRSILKNTECEQNSTFNLFFGVNALSVGNKDLNTYEVTVWYNPKYVTLNGASAADVSGTNGYLQYDPNQNLEKTVRGMKYTGKTLTFTSFEKGFGQMASGAFKALLKIPFKATSLTGATDIFIEDQGVSMLPVSDGVNFYETINSTVANDSVVVTIRSTGNSFGPGAGAGAGIVSSNKSVVFNVDGAKTVVSVTSGQRVSMPAMPVKEGYTFAGWYKDKNFTAVFDFTAPITADIELFAKFVKNESPSVPSALPFVDVKEGDWFYEGVKYVFEKNMVKGLTETTYGPDVTLNRATLVTLIYRLENEPSAPANTFTDVSDGAWYKNAVAWAAKNEIVLGVGEGLFAPETNITREQIALILYKYTKFKGGDVSKTADLNGFKDVDKISDWAKDALSWAVAEGLIQGMGDGEVAPNATATRAQIATILMRYMK